MFNEHLSAQTYVQYIKPYHHSIGQALAFNLPADADAHFVQHHSVSLSAISIDYYLYITVHNSKLEPMLQMVSPIHNLRSLFTILEVEVIALMFFKLVRDATN
ncbi:hypothetical protein BLOT_013091 [Blomia tropicalis]|nr:hypothetical protein BLOT_013091 [Blomia tropicalis]